MSMLWRDPSGSLMPLRDAMNRLFEGSFIWPGSIDVFTGRTFPVDVYETKDQQGYVVEASIPGAKPEDISVTAMGDTLTINYTTKSEQTVERPNYVRRERYEGGMTRTISLPTQIEPDKVKATYESGVLKLEIPKSEAEKPRKIAIKSQQPAGSR